MSEQKEILHIEYSGNQFDFRNDGWFNATTAAAKFGKEPKYWLSQRDNVEYIVELHKLLINNNCCFVQQFNEISVLDSTSAASRTKLLNLAKKTGLVKIKQGSPENGGGTWLHPKLAVLFSRWLDIKFSIWCDMQIDELLRDKTDWKKLRFEAAASYKVMQSILELKRELEGKKTFDVHFITEARLVNWALNGKFEKINRNSLDELDLDLLVRLEEKNGVMIGNGIEYQERKVALETFTAEYRLKNPRLMMELSA